MGDLLGLAERFVRLNAEIEETRSAMLAALMNGAGDKPPIPFSPTVRPRPGGKGPDRKATQEAEKAIVSLLKETPNLGTSAIAKATGSPQVTVQDRLRRLRSRGEIEGGGKDGWRATATG
jgi:hypothetical protein